MKSSIVKKMLIVCFSFSLFSCSSKEDAAPKEKFEELKEDRCKLKDCDQKDSEKDPKEKFEEMKEDYCDQGQCHK